MLWMEQNVPVGRPAVVDSARAGVRVQRHTDGVYRCAGCGAVRGCDHRNGCAAGT
jgi:hypothetical protein